MRLAVCIACSTIRAMDEHQQKYPSNVECRACGSWGFLQLLDIKSWTYEKGIYAGTNVTINEEN